MPDKSKIYMKKYLLIVILLAGFVFYAIPSVVNAQGATASSSFEQQFQTFAKKSGIGEGTPNEPQVVIARLIKVMLGVVGIMFFAYSVYAGYLILSSAGDEQKVKKGKDTLRTGIIGIFVAMSAYSILSLVAGAALQSTELKPGTYLDYDVGTEDYDYGTPSR